VKCGNLSEQDPYFVCGDHVGAKKEMAEHRNKSERLRDQNKAVSDDLNEQVVFTINKKIQVYYSWATRKNMPGEIGISEQSPGGIFKSNIRPVC
jgi:hypothetical protein